MNKHASTNEQTNNVEPRLHLMIDEADEIKNETVNWLWKGRLQAGATNLIFGKSGIGKSFLACTIAAIVSNGGQWPFNEGYCQQGQVMFLESWNEPLRMFTAPRLREAGANLKNIVFIKGVITDPLRDRTGERVKLTKENAALLKDEINRLYNEVPVPVRLVIIDPLSCFLDSGMDQNDPVSFSEVLQPFEEVAHDTGVAIVIVDFFDVSTTLPHVK